IGYSVRPCERKKGYATEILRQNIINCKEYGLDKVLITCDYDNVGSEKVILANGGVFESDIEADGTIKKRYWIKL
ncbi:MAG: GNAT family N-acetyltransferase, partial [Paraclostridium sordellii]